MHLITTVWLDAHAFLAWKIRQLRRFFTFLYRRLRLFWNVRTYPAKILMILYYIFDVFFQFRLVLLRRRAQLVIALVFVCFLEKGLFLYIQVWFFVRNFNSHLYYLQVVLCKIKIIKLFVELLFWDMTSDGTEMFLFVWLIFKELRLYGRFCLGVRNVSWMSAGG